MLAEFNGDEDTDPGIISVNDALSFGENVNREPDFTFQCPRPSSVAFEDTAFERPEGHPAAPTPPSSPTKKRSRSDDTPPSPRFIVQPLMFSPLQAAPCAPDSTLDPGPIHCDESECHVLGSVEQRLSPENTSPSLPSNKRRKLKHTSINQYFSKETREDTLARNTRLLEIARRDGETRRNDAANALVAKVAADKVKNAEKQQRHRDRVRAQKVADGWKPNGERVSHTMKICGTN